MMKMFNYGLYVGLLFGMSIYYLNTPDWVLGLAPLILIFLFGAKADDHYNENIGWHVSTRSKTE